MTRMDETVIQTPYYLIDKSKLQINMEKIARLREQPLPDVHVICPVPQRNMYDVGHSGLMSGWRRLAGRR